MTALPSQSLPDARMKYSPIMQMLLEPSPEERGRGFASLRVRAGAWILVPRSKRLPRDGLAIYNPQRLRGKLAKRLLQFVPRFAPTIYLRSDAVADLCETLRDCLGGEAVDCAFYFRSPGLFSKTIVLALDAAGRAIAYVKFGSSSETNETLAHEGEVLDRLAKAHGLSACVPQVIGRTTWRGFPAMLLSAGPSTGTSLVFGAAHRDFLEQLRSATQWSGPLHESAMWRTMTARKEALACRLEPRWRDRYDFILHQAQHDIGDATVSFGLAHRDFVPWNIRADGAGDLFVFDWELASEQCTPAWDFFHFHLAARSVRARHFDIASLLTLAARARGDGIEPAETFLNLYLADVALFLHDRLARAPAVQPNLFLESVGDAIDILRKEFFAPSRRKNGKLPRHFGLPAPLPAVLVDPVLRPAAPTDD